MADFKFEYFGGKHIFDDILQNINEIDSNSDTNARDDLNNQENCDSIKIYGAIYCYGNTNIEQIYLKEPIGDGGEGAVFLTDIEGYAAKIYYPRHRKEFRRQKLTFMAEHPINSNNICWPVGVLSYQGEFVGVLMPLINTKKYKLINPLSQIDDIVKFFKGSKSNVLTLLLNICKIFEVLREHNVVMGDVNFKNFFINKDTYDAILIDVDGAQIDKYPCITSSSGFNPPEIFDSKREFGPYDDDAELSLEYYHNIYSQFYRDNYSFSCFAFILLLQDKPYFDLQELTQMDFAYEKEDNHPLGNKWNNWTHLPGFVKEAFVYSFTSKDASNRPDIFDWETIFTKYKKILSIDDYKTLDEDCDLFGICEEFDSSKISDLSFLDEYKCTARGLSIKSCLEQIYAKAKSDGHEIKEDINYVVNTLLQHPLLEIDKTRTFRLLLNIGVLSKIEFRYINE